VNGVPQPDLVVNTASWTTFDLVGDPSLDQTGPSTTPFYALASDMCDDNTAGSCSDGTRWVNWPNVPPVVTVEYPTGFVLGYTWISQQHLSGLSVLNGPTPTMLYSVSWDPSSGDALPTTSLNYEEFFAGDQPSYGTYATMVYNNTVYLYGLLSDGSVALAQCPQDAPYDITQYQYYVGGEWTTTIPSYTDTSATIPNMGAGGQGTVYYSDYWESFVWIGGSVYPGAAFYISTSPTPEGPWTQAVSLYTGTEGNAALPAYSCVAHPGLTSGTGTDIYLTYTNVTNAPDNTVIYNTPLLHVEWQ